MFNSFMTSSSLVSEQQRCSSMNTLARAVISSTSLSSTSSSSCDSLLTPLKTTQAVSTAEDDPYTFNDNDYPLTKNHVNSTNALRSRGCGGGGSSISNTIHDKPKRDASDSNKNNSIIDISTTHSTSSTNVQQNLRRVNLKSVRHETLQRIRSVVKTQSDSKWHAPQNINSVFSSSDSESDRGDEDDEKTDIMGNVLNAQVFYKMDELRLNRDLCIQRYQDRIQRVIVQQHFQWNSAPSTTCLRTICLVNELLGIRSQQMANKIFCNHRKFRARLQTRTSNSGMLPPRQCSYTANDIGGRCKQLALPCTRHCSRHIMHNSDQLLYDYCTAKFADNTQCCIPVFDLNHELPLCAEHARKRDNYNKMCQVVKPKKPRKKVKPSSAMCRTQKRSKKRKRTTTTSTLLTSSTISSQIHDQRSIDQKFIDNSFKDTSSACDSSDDLGLGSLAESSELSSQNQFGNNDNHEDDMVAQVLGVDEELPLELVTGPNEALVNQASRLLEETDLTNVFNQIPPDAFNDLFAIDRNGVYEPTREETEELERALEAVNQDVKSLEKMSQTQGILDTLLDEHTLVQSLVQMPTDDVFLNGFSSSSGSAVVPTTTRHNLDNIISIQPSAPHLPS